MTLDERLENLTRNVELLFAMHRDSMQRSEGLETLHRESMQRFEKHEQRLQQHQTHLDNFKETAELLTAMQRDNENRFDQVTRDLAQVGRNFEIVLDSIRRLENIATAHEQRLDDLEGGQ